MGLWPEEGDGVQPEWDSGTMAWAWVIVRSPNPLLGVRPGHIRGGPLSLAHIIGRPACYYGHQMLKRRLWSWGEPWLARSRADSPVICTSSHTCVILQVLFWGRDDAKWCHGYGEIGLFMDCESRCRLVTFAGVYDKAFKRVYTLSEHLHF